ncbi:MAG TPA: tetratricopeptide repeat protein, partial [Pyrinomonadaceae bacterium]|nr:tetratricopeptide repeat protein [Pyrinomonadaceae bacterium]
MNERALSIYEKGGAADSLGAAAVLSAHANVLAAQGAGDAAVSAGRRALQIFEKQYGPESVPAAGAAFALANILHNSKSQSAESQALYERALRVYESKFGAESPAVAATLNALALPLLAKGDAAGALAAHARALRIAEKVYGPESPAAAQAAQAVGYVFFQTRELAKARAAYERALSLYEKAFGAESPAALGALNAVGGVLVAEGQHAAAREKFDRAIRIGEKLYGPESQPVAFNLLSKAATYQGAEHYAVVSDFYDRAVKIYEKVYGAESVPVADVLAAAGDYDRSHDKEQSARARYERAVKIYEQAQGREAAAVGFLLLKIGKSLGEENKSAEAFEPLSRAMSIYEKYYGENHLALADPLTELAAAYAFRNDLTKAAGLLQRSLKILEDHKLGDELVVTDTLDPLAFLLLAEGKLDAGQEVATRSLKVYESHPRHTFYADEIDLRNALGSILLMKGDFVAARAFMEATVARAEKTLGPQSPEMLRAVYNMTYLLAAQGDFETVTRHIARTRAHSQALVESGDPMAVQILQLTAALSAHQGREDEARELIKKSAESAEKIFGPDNFITAQVLTGLASMLASVNDHAGAESINARALRIFEQTGTGTGLAALARSNKGDLLLRQGKLSEARAAYEEAAQTLERQRNSKHIMTAGVLNSLGRVNLLQNDIPKAQAAFLKAADLTGHHIQSVLPSLSLAEQRVFLELEMPEQISSLLTSCRDGAAVGNAYELMFRWKGSLIDSLRRQTVVTRLGLSGPHGKQVARLRAVRADIAGLYYKARTMPVEEWQRKNDELTREKEELERELARLLKPGELADPLAAGFREFQRLLRPDEVFLDVYLYDFRRRDNTVESRYAVVNVGPSGSPSLADLGPAKRINEAVKAWRTEVLARVDADAEWAALSALLWKPLAESLPAGARRVWVSPDGELARLPWQLLAGTHAKTKDF